MMEKLTEKISLRQHIKNIKNLYKIINEIDKNYFNYANYKGSRFCCQTTF